MQVLVMNVGFNWFVTEFRGFRVLVGNLLEVGGSGDIVLLLVAGTLKEMVESLVSGIEGSHSCVLPLPHLDERGSGLLIVL